jgi:hypothetical protein
MCYSYSHIALLAKLISAVKKWQGFFHRRESPHPRVMAIKMMERGVVLSMSLVSGRERVQ